MGAFNKHGDVMLRTQFSGRHGSSGQSKDVQSSIFDCMTLEVFFSFNNL